MKSLTINDSLKKNGDFTCVETQNALGITWSNLSQILATFATNINTLNGLGQSEVEKPARP
jgi:hypothetical protein